MSWNVAIIKPDGETLPVERHNEGGTYVLGGITEAELNVTYNYSKLYHEHLGLREGFRGLDGMSVYDALPFLKRGCDALPDDAGRDYWAPTPGNAGHALHLLKRWCEEAIRTEDDWRFSVH